MSGTDYYLLTIHSKHKCDNNGEDPFKYMRKQIGYSSPLKITMSMVSILTFIYRRRSSNL